jgi:hypothetical protein
MRCVYRILAMKPYLTRNSVLFEYPRKFLFFSKRLLRFRCFQHTPSHSVLPNTRLSIILSYTPVFLDLSLSLWVLWLTFLCISYLCYLPLTFYHVITLIMLSVDQKSQKSCSASLCGILHEALSSVLCRDFIFSKWHPTALSTSVCMSLTFHHIVLCTRFL